MHIGELAEASANSINDRASGDDFFHHLARGADRGMRTRRDFDRLVRKGDAGDFRERKRPATELHHCAKIRYKVERGNPSVEHLGGTCFHTSQAFQKARQEKRMGSSGSTSLPEKKKKRPGRPNDLA